MSAPLRPEDRDVVIRTIIGEAASQGEEGWAAVGHVIRNRQLDGRFPNTAKGVALQDLQFSAWNRGEGGNHLPHKYNPGDRVYENVGRVVDAVWGGQSPDPTGGATHYYAPAGMPGGREPRWWTQVVSEGAGRVTTIGGHRFAGKVRGGDGIDYDPAAPANPNSPSPAIQAQSPYADVLTPSPPTNDEERAAADEAAQRRAGYGFFDAVGDSAQADWALSWALSTAGPKAIDPDFRMTRERFDQLTKDLPEDYWPQFKEARSEDHAEAIRAHAVADVEREQRLAEGGAGTTALRLAMSVLDPVALAVSVGTEGVAAPFLAAAKVGRVGRILGGAAVAGTGNAAAEVVASTVNPKVGLDDIAASFGVGMVLGGTFGALRRNPATQDEADAFVRMGQRLSAQGPFMDPAGSVGAAATGRRTAIHSDLPVLDPGDAPELAFGGLGRFDIGGQLGKSPSQLTRVLAPHMGEEAVGYADHSVIPDSATNVQRVIHARTVRDWYSVSRPAFAQWADERGLSWWQRPKGWEDFNRLVHDHVMDPMPPDDVPAPVAAAAGEFRRLMARQLDMQQNPRAMKGGEGRAVAGFDGLQKDDTYVPRYADHALIDSHFNRFGERALVEFVEGAFLRKARDLKWEPPEGVARKVAQGYLKALVRAGYGMHDELDLAFSRADRPAFTEKVREALGANTLSDEEIETLFGAFHRAPEKDGGTATARNKRRTFLDYNFEGYLRTTDGGYEKLSMRDFFHRDADFALNRYSRAASGWTALAQMEVRNPRTGELLLDGVTSKQEWDKVLNWVRDDYATNVKGDHAGKRQALDNDLANLRLLFDAVTGTPHYNARGPVMQALRRVRDVNFVRLMSNMGWNQLIETKNALGSLGLKASLQQLPAFRRIVQDGRSIPDKDRLLQELEALGDTGTDMDFSFLQMRYGDERIGEEVGRAGRRFDNAMDAMKEATLSLSLMRHIQGIQQKWVAKAATQRLYDFAKKTDGGEDLDRLGGKDLEKLRSIGFSDEDLEAVFGQLLAHGTVEKGSRLVTLNIDSWDPAARHRFAMSMTRWTDRIIHRNDTATLAKWMSHPVAALVTQFRTFMLGSWAKQTLYNLHHMDARTAVTMAAGLVAGAGTYALMETVKSAGQKDPDAYLAEKLAWDKLVAAGFARAGWSSIMPAAVDTAMFASPFDPVFSDVRASGSAMDAALGSPTGDFIDTLFMASKGMTGAAWDGRPISQQELRSVARSLPWGNWLPVASFYSYLISGQPQYPPRGN